MASFTRRKDSFLIRVCTGRDYDNKQTFASMTFKPNWVTKSGKPRSEKVVLDEVQKEALKFEERVLSGEFYSGEKLTFMNMADTWRTNWANDKENITTSTQESYWDLIQRWAFPVIGKKKMSKITALDIQNNIVKAMKNAGKAPATIRRTIAAVNSVFKYAYRMDMIKENVVNRVQLPKMNKDKDEDLHYFTVEQSKRFLEALEMKYPFQYASCVHSYGADGARYRETYTAYHTIPLQYRSYFYLAIYGGFRRGELVALTWKDINFSERTVSINKAFARTISEGQIEKGPKTKAGIREIQLPEKCFQVLREWRSEQMQMSLTMGDDWKGSRGKNFDDNYIFINLKNGLAMNVDTPSHKFHEIIEMYNRTCEREEDRLPKIRLHDLRHTSATLLIANNIDIETVSHRLGHSKPSVTMDVYGHALKSMDSTASDKLEAIFA